MKSDKQSQVKGRSVIISLFSFYSTSKSLGTVIVVSFFDVMVVVQYDSKKHEHF